MAQQIIELTLCHLNSAQMGDEEISKMLLRWEPQLWHQRDLNGMLPLHWCCSRGYTGVTNQLLLALHSESKFLTVSKLQKKLIFCNFNYDKKKLFLLVPILKMAKKPFLHQKKGF